MIRQYFLAVVLIAASFTLQASNNAAKIVSQHGQTHWRSNQSTPWLQTQVSQTLATGQHLKTGRQSKLGILFRDNSQIRLNQNSLFIVNDVLDEQGNSTRFRLNRGRAWIKSKNIPNKLILETPSAVAAIRGTDWDIEVGPNGTATLTVINGQIHFYNEFGEVLVNENEQAIAQVGQAPVKVHVTNPKQRVQWVSEYQINANRFSELAISEPEKQVLTLFNSAGLTQFSIALNSLPHSAFKSALLADTELYYGNSQKALNHITLIKNYESIPVLYALFGQAHLMQGTAKILAGNHHAILYHNAKAALFMGDGDSAIINLQQLLSKNPNHYQALTLLGHIFTEKAYTKSALSYLLNAVQSAPNKANAYAELANLYTKQNKFNNAKANIQLAKKYGKSDALIHIAEGLVALKQKNTVSAKQHFLSAEINAPSLARIHSFMAILYYQENEFELALASLKQAKLRDPNDPIPYLYQAIIERERYAPQAAMLQAKEAKARLPYLKSLDQVAVNLAGDTNLGAAYDSYGLGQWALSTAIDSYNPFWAGSQLFLSQQLSNQPIANTTELYRGLLNNPNAIANNKAKAPLLLQPGINATLGAHYYKVDNQNLDGTTTKLPTLSAQINGYSNQYLPISFLFEQQSIKPQTNTLLGQSNSTLDAQKWALSVSPLPELSLFALSQSTEHSTNDSTANNDAVKDDTAENLKYSANTGHNYKLIDSFAGAKYQLHAKNQLSYSYFDLSQKHQTQQTNQGTDEILGVDTRTVYSWLNLNQLFPSQSTISHQLNWQVENRYHHYFNLALSRDTHQRSIKTNTNGHLQIESYYKNELIYENATDTLTKSHNFDQRNIEQAHFYWQSAPFNSMRVDLLMSQSNLSGLATAKNETNDQLHQQETTYKKEHFDYGIGVKTNLSPTTSVSLSYLKWLNSGAAVIPTTTHLGGLAFNTRYTRAGGQLKRTAIALKHENQFAFYQFEFDRQLINNHFLPDPLNLARMTDFQITNRALDSVITSPLSLFKFNNTHLNNAQLEFEQGSINQYRINAEFIMNQQLTGSFGYRYTDIDPVFLAETSDEIKTINRDNSQFKVQHSRSQLALGLSYALPSNTLPFANAVYLTYPSSETKPSDGWVWQIGVRQALFNRKLMIQSKLRKNQITHEKEFWFSSELRF